MQTWHILITAYVLLISIYELLSKYFIHKMPVLVLVFYQYLTSLIIVPILYFAVSKPNLSHTNIPWWFILMGVFWSIAVYCFQHAKKQSLSKSMLMNKTMNGVSIFFLVILFGEFTIIDPRTDKGLLHLVGLCLIFIAIYLLYHRKTHEGSETSFNYKEWAKWITPFVVIIGIGQSIVKPLVAIYDPLLLLSLQYLGSFSTMAFLCLYKKTKIIVEKKYIAGALLTGLFSSVGVAVMYTSLLYASGTQIFAIAAIGVPVITLLAAVFIFKERFTRRMVLPFLLALVSILLLG